MVTIEDEQEMGCVIRNLSSEVPPEVEIWRKCACARKSRQYHPIYFMFVLE